MDSAYYMRALFWANSEDVKNICKIKVLSISNYDWGVLGSRIMHVHKLVSLSNGYKYTIIIECKRICRDMPQCTHVASHTRLWQSGSR